MALPLIFSGTINPENIHDVFFHICGVLEGKNYSLSKENIASSSVPITRSDQRLRDTTIKKVGPNSQISIKGNSGDIIIAQILSDLDPKKDPDYPHAEISADQILIFSQNRKGSKEKILISIED